MVLTNGLDDLWGKAPLPAHDLSRFAMAEPVSFFFHNVDGTLSNACLLHDLVKLISQYMQVHNEANVMEEPGQVRLLRISRPNPFCDSPADQRTGQGVLPKDYRIDAFRFRRHEFQHTARNGDISHSLKSERDDRAPCRSDCLPSSEQGRIRQVKTLRRERIVMRDEIYDPLNIECLERLLQISDQRLNNGIHAGNRIKVIKFF
jgi:hypothetical protein